MSMWSTWPPGGGIVDNRNNPSIVLARFFGKRVVVHFGLLESEKYLSRWRSLLGPIFRMADEIVVNSRYSSAVFQRYSLRTKVVAAPVDVELIPERHVTSCNRRSCSIVP